MPDAKTVAAAMLADLGDRTAQVIVLKGAWGCGKSYLWAHQVVPQLAAAKVTVVTTSLFGVSSVDELRNRLATGAMFAAPSMVKNTEDRFATLKQVGGGAAKQLGKMLGQAFDEYAGTSAFASRVDYLELVPEGVVFCIDDVERAGTEVDVRGILGVVNYLVEVKKCRVVLIMDDEKLEEKQEEFHRFKERVVRALYSLEPDLPTAYDRLATAHLTGPNLPEVKAIVLDTFERVGHPNLRTLDRALRLIGRLTRAATRPLPNDAVAFAVVMVLEDAVGHFGPRDRYEFATVTLLFQDRDSAMAAQREFLRRYYPDVSSYQFVSAIFDAVATGIIDGTRLAEELYPENSPSTEAARLVALTQNDSFGFLGDQGYAEFVQRVANRMADVDTPLTASEAVRLFGSASFAAERAGLTWNGDIEDHARTHVEHAAGGTDEALREGFDVHMFMANSSYLRDLLDVYTRTAREREAKEREGRLIAAIDRCDVGALGRAIDMQWELLRMLTTDASLLSRVLSSPDARFRHYAIEVVVDKLAEFGDTQFPWVPAAKRQVHAALADLQARASDNSERQRLDRRLRVTATWAAVTGASESASAEGEAHDADDESEADAEL
jgi:hypothetical protein